MHKKYKKHLKSTWFIIPLFGASPLVKLIFDPYIDETLLVQIALYLLASILVYKYHNRTAAEIQGDTLRFYSGIGLSDPSQINIHTITQVERKSKNMLIIHYGNTHLSIEAHHRILSDLEKDLAKN